MRAIRSQTASPSTTVELQSSEVVRVTTETTIGSRSGEYSKQSFAQRLLVAPHGEHACVERCRELDLDPRAEQEVAARRSDQARCVELRPAEAGVDEPVGPRPGDDRHGVAVDGGRQRSAQWAERERKR